MSRATARLRRLPLFHFLACFVLASVGEAAELSPRLEHVPETVDGQIPVMIETGSAEAVAARIEELGGRVEHVFRAIEGLSATVPASAYEEILDDSRVRTVQRQRYVHRAVVSRDRLGFEERGLRVPPDTDDTFVSMSSGRFTVRQVALGDMLRGDDDGEEQPRTYIGYEPITRAAEVWDATDYGARTVTAIIDTGVYDRHPMYEGNVIGGFNLVPREEEEAIDLDENGQPDGRSFPWHSVHNDPHGTFVAGLIAGHVDLEFDENDSFITAVNGHSPESVVFDGAGRATVRLFGIAPRTDLYAVKVFPYHGGSAPDARVVEAIDRLIEMKREGEVDVDVINMSLSGPVLFDGWNPLDRIINKATKRGITCVSAAANAGPSLISVGSPASAFTGLAVGAAVDPIHTRAAVEDLFGAPPGAGSGFYPEDRLQVASFSSRGLTADKRVKPDLVATGFLVYSSTLEDVTKDGVPDEASFGWSFGGTSFAAPIVSGAAALVTAYGQRQRGPFGRAPFVANVLEASAAPIAEFPRISQREQGFGYVDVAEAVRLMRRHRIRPPRDSARHALQSHHDLRDGVVSASSPELGAGDSFTFNLEVRSGVKKIDFTFPTVTLGDVQNPFFGDQLTVVIHSAKRGGSGDYVFGDNVAPGDAFTYEDPEPGTIRVTMNAGVGNWSPAMASLRAEATTGSYPTLHTFRGKVRRNGTAEHSVDIPDGMSAIGVKLAWRHDWTKYPTVDLDLFIETPLGTIPAASIDSPELVWIEDPPAGEWEFEIHDIGSLRGKEHYTLEIMYRESVGRFEESVDMARPRVAAARPNPFAAETAVSFTVPSRGRVSLRVYDVAGRVVQTLVDETLDAGPHDVRWDGRSSLGRQTSSGVYFLRLETAEGVSNRKVVRLD